MLAYNGSEISFWLVVIIKGDATKSPFVSNVRRAISAPIEEYSAVCLSVTTAPFLKSAREKKEFPLAATEVSLTTNCGTIFNLSAPGAE